VSHFFSLAPELSSIKRIRNVISYPIIISDLRKSQLPYSALSLLSATRCSVLSPVALSFIYLFIPLLPAGNGSQGDIQPQGACALHKLWGTHLETKLVPVLN
jgi:hypothetical protein